MHTLRGGYFHGESNTSWQCYHLKGRAGTFNLMPKTFNFIGRSSDFGIIESRVLDIKCGGWLKQDGIYGLFPFDGDGFEEAITIDGAEIAFRPRMFILKQGLDRRAFAFAPESNQTRGSGDVIVRSESPRH